MTFMYSKVPIIRTGHLAVLAVHSYCRTGIRTGKNNRNFRVGGVPLGSFHKLRLHLGVGRWSEKCVVY